MASYESSDFAISIPPRAKRVAEIRFDHLLPREALGAELAVEQQPPPKRLRDLLDLLPRRGLASPSVSQPTKATNISI